MLQKVINSAQLISLPEIYLKLKELIDDSDFSMAEVALLVESDPAMATRFLQVVNSPLYQGVKKIEAVSHAVSLLGIHQVHDIILSTSVAKAFEGIQNDVMNMKKFWQRSFYCAVLAKQLALECATTDSDRLVTIGLLHDIGHLFMYLAIPEESQQVILDAKKLELPIYQVERDLLGFDYAELGGYMMRKWDLPLSLQVTTRFHPEPGKAKHFALGTALLHLSSLLVQSDLEEGVFGEGAFAVDPGVWPTTNLTEEQCLNCRQIAADQLDELANSLFF